MSFAHYTDDPERTSDVNQVAVDNWTYPTAHAQWARFALWPDLTCKSSVFTSSIGTRLHLPSARVMQSRVGNRSPQFSRCGFPPSRTCRCCARYRTNRSSEVHGALGCFMSFAHAFFSNCRNCKLPRFCARVGTLVPQAQCCRRPSASHVQPQLVAVQACSLSSPCCGVLPASAFHLVRLQ